MNKCSPIEMRKNLELVDTLRKHGIDFVAVPVRDNNHKNELINLGYQVLEEVAKENE